MEDINIHSKMYQFRALLAVVAIILAVVTFIYPDHSVVNTYARAILSLLISVVVGSYAFDRFRDKKWLAGSAYALVTVLNLIVLIQIVFPSIYF